MSDRGNCKFFSPNYFNPTKCQNCFKQKDQHVLTPETPNAKLPLSKRSSSLGRHVQPVKTILKESALLRGTMTKDEDVPKAWSEYWFTLLSNGELQQYEISNGQVNKENMVNSVMLKDFIRMLDGKNEIGEDMCFGVNTLRDTTYFKAKSKVDYVNWWKEFSSFVPAPIKRTTSSASALRSHSGSGQNYSKPARISKQHSMPAQSLMSKLASRPSRSSSISSVQSDPEQHPQMESLRYQVSKLEQENAKLSKAEAERRKLELEVNYWKEFVTNTNSLKQSGASIDVVSELSGKQIQLQDELNETHKRLKTNQGKLLIQNKELADAKEKLRESNSLVAVHKAKIEHLAKELQQQNQEKSLVIPSSAEELFYNGNKESPAKTELSLSRPSAEVQSSSAQHLEDKFLILKDRLKRIEKELYFKSKELEKANESRSKVAKYTRTLLQELETRISDKEQKLMETQEKLKHANTELEMERERRMKLEEGPRRRMSSVASPPKSRADTGREEWESVSTDLSDHDADTKYADYYRSRFKEAEASLLEKDMKLHNAEEKIKELQQAMKSNSESYKVINDLQAKLADATHKLSDRQLKIHELNRETDRLKEYEKTYTKKSKRCDTLEDIVKELEKTNSDQKKNLHQVKQELEMIKIREVVLHEQLQTFLEDSEHSDDDHDDEEDEDHKVKLGKSIDLKKKIECMIELEALSKKLTIDNEKLVSKNAELETRLKKLNIQNFKSLEANKHNSGDSKPYTNAEKEKFEQDIKELQEKLSKAEEKYCNEMTMSKEKYLNEVATSENKHSNEKKELKESLERAKSEIEKVKEQYDGECNELRGKLTMLQLKLTDIEENLRSETQAHKNTQTLLEERSKLLNEIEDRCKRITMERDMLKDGQGIKRSSRSSSDASSDEKLESLSNQNTGLKIKIRQLERQLRISSEKFEDVISSLKEKASLDSGKQDRDSGIVITQEIKSIIDSYNRDISDGTSHSEILREESEDIFITPRTSISDNEKVEKYKRLYGNIDGHELTKKLMVSEEKVIQLAEELDKHLISEDEYVSKYNTLVTRIEDLQTQILESQETLQSKADELERERKNVINLVEVTSAYIKELEGSLAESKNKIQELQLNISDCSDARQPPDGSSTEEVGQKDDTPLDRQALLVTVSQLQAEIAELKSGHVQEVKLAHMQTELEAKTLQKQKRLSSSSEDTGSLQNQISTLTEELQKQKDDYRKDIQQLQEQYQEELKAAFNGDTTGIDMLNRVQELEMELDETRRDLESKVKEITEQCQKEKEQMKEDMATVLQASLTMSSESLDQNTSYQTASQTELEEKIVNLEQELIEIGEKYQEELEMEKDAHQKEMEDTIRDMMLLRDASNRYDEGPANDTENKRSGSLSTPDSQLKKIYSTDDVEAIKSECEKRLEALQEEHENELTQRREDMALIINSIKQGGYSDTIMELQGKIKDLELEIEDLKIDFDRERKDLDQKFKKSESKNFFHLRRNEEMGSKIYQMQIELEEVDRKHQIELQAYQDKLAALGGDVDDEDGINESMKLQEQLQEKNRELEKTLEKLQAEHDSELEALTLSLQSDKRESMKEMTDHALQLEQLLDELKEKHEKEIQQFENVERKENMEASAHEKERIKELENACENLKEEYEDEIEELAKEHKKEVEKLRLFYEREIGEMKKRTSSDVEQPSRRSSVDHGLKTALKEQKEKYEKEIEVLRQKFSKEKDLLVETQERDIEDIRIQYDEKLKTSYKEGLRRQSISERKSDASRMKELIAEKEMYQTKLLELEINHDADAKQFAEKIRQLQKIITDLREQLKTGAELSKQTIDSINENETFLDDESTRQLKEINEQIERYERRIEYYREKSQRENTEESHRVSELQSEIVELHKKRDEMKDSQRRSLYEREKYEKAPGSKSIQRRNTDGSTPRRHTDTETFRSNTRELRDPKKRWSDLHERTEREDGKSGTVLARKTLWEGISVDETGIKTRLSKPTVK